MPLIDRIHECNLPGPEGLIPWRCDKHRVGWLDPSMAERLLAQGDVFVRTGDEITLNPRYLDYPSRSLAIEACLREVIANDPSGFGRWNGETTPVIPELGAAPLLEVQRCAVVPLGIIAGGVHLNGYIEVDGEIKMWVSQRSLKLDAQPGQWDQLCAGFLPHLADPATKLSEEAEEEAGIDKNLITQAKPAGAIFYGFRRPHGIQRGAVHVYDLKLPKDFVPNCQDGSVEQFVLLDRDSLLHELEKPGHFKWDCALVAIDFLIRHGLIGPEHPHYLALVAGLRPRI